MVGRARWVVVPAILIACTVTSVARGGAGELRKALDQAKAAAQSGDADAMARAVQAALAEGGKPPVKGLLELAAAFPPGKEALYWQVVGGVASVHDAQGLDAVTDLLCDHGDQPVARDLILALQGNHDAAVLEVYRRVLRPRQGPLQVAAVDRVSELERVEAIDLLLELLKREDGSGSALERRLRSALSALFGSDMGDRRNYEGWWQAHKDAFFHAGGAGGGSQTGTVDLDRAREGGLATATRGGRVLVIRGKVKNFDEIEKILDRLHVRYETMLKTDLNEHLDEALRGTAALIFNCSFAGNLCDCPTCKPGTDPNSRLPVCTGCNQHHTFSDQLTPDAVNRVKAWVAEGGCVFTEDQGLKELTAVAWPEYVAVGGNLAEGEVDYAPAPGQTDTSLLRGVLVSPGAAAVTMTERRTSRWKIDNLSSAIHLADPARVQVLLTSGDLRARSNGDGSVAVAFSPGASTATTAGGPGRRPPQGGGGTTSGRNPPPAAARPGLVLHVLSHFGHQQNEQDEFTLQNLLVNFLLEAQARCGERPRR